jgi:hypothetical protein
MVEKKLFVVRKYVLALSALEAIKVEKRCPVDDVWMDDEWRRDALTRREPPVGGFKKKS